MIILSAQDLDDYGIRQTASTITFMGRAFVRGQTFANRLRKMAIEMAEDNIAKGRPCLLVDFETHITLWRANSRATQIAEYQVSPVQNLSDTDWIKATSKPKSSKSKSSQASGLKYRGQTVEPSPSTPLRSEKLASRKPMMYRGKPVGADRMSPDVQTSESSPQETTPSSNSPASKPKRQLRYRGRLVDAD